MWWILMVAPFLPGSGCGGLGVTFARIPMAGGHRAAFTRDPMASGLSFVVAWVPVALGLSARGGWISVANGFGCTIWITRCDLKNTLPGRFLGVQSMCPDQRIEGTDTHWVMLKVDHRNVYQTIG